MIVEDGTQITGANSYAALVRAGTYHQKRGRGNDWQALMKAGAGEGMLIEATGLLERTYTWQSEIASTTQGLSLPRLTITFVDGRTCDGAAQVALAAEAVAFLALRLYTDRANGQRVVSERLPDVTITYADEPHGYDECDWILTPIVEGGGLSTAGINSGQLVRWS
jgi:hypothetical protein